MYIELNDLNFWYKVSDLEENVQSLQQVRSSICKWYLH